MSDCLCGTCEDNLCRPSITLDEFRESLCINPYYFFQMGQWATDYPGTIIPIRDTPCEIIVYERCHSGCTVMGRDEICRAIARADNAFEDFMGYPPALRSRSAEFYFGYMGKWCLNNTGQKPFYGGILQLPHNRISRLGKEELSYIETVNVNPVTLMSDTNNDNLLDTFTLTINQPVGATTDEITLFFVESDRGKSNCCRWEIRPIAVIDNENGTFTITASSWVMAKPIAMESWSTIDIDQEILDPSDYNIYPTELDVYRRWVDPTKAVTICRKPISCTCGKSVGDECYETEEIDACLISQTQGLIDITFPPKGNCGCCPQCAQKLCINYVAGDCNNEELIAHLAAAYIPGNICCSPSNQMIYWQQEYVAVSERGKQITTLTQAEQSNQFGTRRGQVDAYRILRGRRGNRGRTRRIGIL